MSYNKVACTTGDNILTQYYVMQSGVAALYMGTYATQPPTNSSTGQELRYTARFAPSLMSGGFWNAANYNPYNYIIEGTLPQGDVVSHHIVTIHRFCNC